MSDFLTLNDTDSKSIATNPISIPYKDTKKSPINHL